MIKMLFLKFINFMDVFILMDNIVLLIILQIFIIYILINAMNRF